jgi:flagellar biosynthesis GTPase FlhF
MRINVCTVLHGSFSIELPNQTATVRQIKEKIMQQEGYEIPLQTLVLEGKKLDDATVVKPNSTLILLMKLNESRDQYMSTQQIEHKKRVEAEVERQRQLAIEKERQLEAQRQQQQQQEAQRLQQMQSRQEQIRRQLEQIQFPTMDEFEVDNNSMAILMEMGFSQYASKKALLLNRMNVNAAAEWLFSNMHSHNVEAPLSRQEMLMIMQQNPQYHSRLQQIQQQLQEAGLLPPQGPQQQ